MSPTAVTFKPNDTIMRLMRESGGGVFVIVLALTSIFVLALFDLRAEKIFTLAPTIQEASKEDLVAFWRAAHLAIEGAAASAYDADIFRAPLEENNRGLLWLNPPHMLLLVGPLALLPYGVAKLIWIALSVISLGLIARLTKASPMLLVAIFLSPALFASLLVLQSGPMIALGLLAALLISDRRPILAGLIFAFLTVKPQYGFLIPVFLVARGEWRTILYTVLFSAALFAVSTLAFGIDAWSAFFLSATGDTFAGHAERLHRDMLTLHQTIGKFGGGLMLRQGAQLIAMIGAGVIVYFAAKNWKRDAAIATTLLLAAIASPSLWVYDWPMIAAGLFMLARAMPHWPAHIQLAAGALWITPLISLGFGTMQSAAIAGALAMGATVSVMIWMSSVHASTANN
ncbi:MAG: hypothetical protein DHS20C05_06450 [Hyphococcus sp.]|nr:MAG: hypothetical protein DHS20C05_06450 [Marinicaulis sp.]